MPLSVEVTQVPAARLDEVWPFVEAWIDAALEQGAGEYIVEDVRAALDEGAWQMWIAVEPGAVVAMALTAIHEYPRKRILWLHLAGGSSPDAVAAMWGPVRLWARGQGCAAMSWHGRRGWWRGNHLPDGARHIHDVVSLSVMEDA